MVIREAAEGDIKQIQVVRNLVKENPLSDPGLVTDALCKEYLLDRGKGWVCVIRDTVVGFSIVDLKEHNVWALFVRPDYEKQGIGRRLHDVMLNWYFKHTDHRIWLSTGSGTRAEGFYLRAGWEEAGAYGGGEVKFEMTRESWNKL